MSMHMKGRAMWIWGLAIVVAALMAYVRLSPNQPDVWHIDVPTFEDKSFAGGAIRVITGDAADLARLHDIIVASGARLIAGSVEQGHVTYISRTAIMGFPDFTTVQLKDGKIALYGRLRFGKSDFGVNGRRIEGWLNMLAGSGPAS